MFEKLVEQLKIIYDKYNRQDGKQIEDTISMLCSKGIANGCYQDYAMLMDIVSVMTIFENAIKEK